MSDKVIVETIGRLIGNLDKPDDGRYQYNKLLDDKMEAFSILFDEKFDESPHVKDARLYRQKIINDMLGHRTHVVAAVDNRDLMHIKYQMDIEQEYQKSKAKYVERHRRNPPADIDMEMRKSACDTINGRTFKSSTTRRSGQFLEEFSDRLVRLFDNCTVDVLNLNNGMVITRMVASVHFLNLMKEAVLFDAMYNPKMEYMSRDERVKATANPNSKQRKKIGNKIADIDALIPIAQKIDSIQFDPSILKGNKHWGNLGDFHNIIWDTLDDDSFNANVLKPIIDAGMIHKSKSNSNNQIVESIADMMSARNRLTCMPR